VRHALHNNNKKNPPQRLQKKKGASEAALLILIFSFDFIVALWTDAVSKLKAFFLSL
jgi:hypothetical protein